MSPFFLCVPTTYDHTQALFLCLYDCDQFLISLSVSRLCPLSSSSQESSSYVFNILLWNIIHIQKIISHPVKETPMLLPPRSKNRKHFRNPCMSLPNRILLTPFCPSSKYSDFCSHRFLAFVCSFTLSVHIFKQHLFLSSFQLCIQEITFSALLSSFNFMFVRFMHVVYTSVIFSSNLGLIRFLPIT